MMFFRKIAITRPEFFVGEGRAIVGLLEHGYSRVHIRKPGSTIAEMATLIESLPSEYRYCISLHDHFCLAEAYGLGGIHLNSRNPNPPTQWEGYISRNFHSLEEIDEIDEGEYDYAFLSPIFPSISKPGHQALWAEELLRKKANRKIIALGGVTPSRFPMLREIGFGGAAMLGYPWRKKDLLPSFGLQFITHPSEKYSYEKEAEMALDGGCKWVQIRYKGASIYELKNVLNPIKDLCHSHGAICIIDDRADLVRLYGLDGVHLGKNDLPIPEARKLVGPDKIIGATANCMSDIEKAASEGADYIGLGPFRFTTTKDNLSPVLGRDGYRRIVAECRSRGIHLPIVAIGGITEDDTPEILRTGVDGIAISSTILKAEDPTEKTKTIINTIQQCQSY